MTEPDFASLLDLVEIAGDHYAGRGPAWPVRRMFGGLLLAQSIAAAGRTLPERVAVHSVHATFASGADPLGRTEYLVDRVRDGMASGLRRVSARQGVGEVCTAMISARRGGRGPIYAPEFPAAPAPEDLPTLAERFAAAGVEPLESRTLPPALDIRHVETPPYLAPDPSVPSRQLTWLRVAETVPAPPITQACVLAYLSDFVIGEPVFRLAGGGTDPAATQLISLDHALWAHGEFDPGEWLLHEQECLAAGGGRVLTRATIFRRSGDLVATATQEGLLHVRRARSRQPESGG